MKGVYVPLITPFDATGAVALDALESLACRVLDEGATGLVALGTTGEPAALSAEERAGVLDVVARVCRERSAELVVGTGTNDTAGTGHALRELGSRPGVTAALVTVPYFLRPGEEGVVAHFAQLAAESPVPLVVYHVPYRTGQVVGAATLRRLAALPGVVGVKYAVGGVDAETVALLTDVPDGFSVLTGDDVVAPALLALGAAGAVLASAHLRTADFVALTRAWSHGDVRGARELGHRLSALSAALFAEPNPAVVKAVLHAQGRIPTPAVRLPLIPAGPAATERALQLLSA